MRVFVAIGLPNAIRDRLAQLQGGIPGAKWEPPENFHITLAFIGEVDGTRVAAIGDTLTGLRNPAFELDIRGVGHFRVFSQRTAVWARVTPSDDLTRLHSSVLRRLETAGLRLARRRFRPHVTLARIRGDTGHHLANFEAEHSLFQLSQIPVTSVHVYESILSPTGASHRFLHECPLSASALDKGDA